MPIMNPRITAIKDETIRTAKSLSGIAIALGGGVIPFIAYLLGWISSGKITVIVPLGIAAAFVMMLIWNISRYAEEGYWHDRKYKLIHNKWKYFPNLDLKTLRAECYGERHLICLSGSISHTTIGVGPRENLVPFDPDDKYDITLDPQSRREHGAMRVRPPHRKEGASFSFRIDFNPPLIEGEEAFVKFKYVLPRFKISTLEHLREKCSQANLDARDYEYNSFGIDYPTDKFIYELHFSPKCCVKARKLEVERGTAIYYPEQLRAQKNGVFTCENVDGGLIMKLERHKPPINVRYRLLWDPPRFQEMKAALQPE
jgi:hypothetical protein